MNQRTVRLSRLKSVTLVSAGALAVALNVVPNTVAIANAISRSSSTTTHLGPNGAMRSAGDDDSSYGDDDSSYGDDDHKGEDCDCKRGPQGFQGEQGEQGFQGFQGFQGEAGGAGEQGPQGFQGNQGPQGFQGAQGGSIETYIVTGNTVTTEGTPSTATCNTGDEVTGGGFTVSGPGNSTSVGSSTPFISAMEGGPEGWQATGAHFAGPNSEVIAFAVCAKTT